jgi:hypothetical protein
MFFIHQPHYADAVLFLPFESKFAVQPPLCFGISVTYIPSKYETNPAVNLDANGKNHNLKLMSNQKTGDV